jgi:hypothetical protein
MSRLRCSGAKSITVDEVTSLRVCAECVKLRRGAGQRSRDHFFGKSSAATNGLSSLAPSSSPHQFIGLSAIYRPADRPCKAEPSDAGRGRLPTHRFR